MKKLVICWLLTSLISSAFADVPISQLPAGTTLGGTEAIPAVQAAATVKTTPAAINTYVQSQTTSATVIGKFTSCSGTKYLGADGICHVASTGTVTSIGVTAPSVFSVVGSPVTTSGTIDLSFATGQTQNLFLASPNGSSGAVGLRAILAADLPAIDLTSKVTGVLPVANGGSGASTLSGILKGNSTSAFSAAISTDVVSLWSGTCNSSSFLRGDGACAAPVSGSTFGADSLSTWNSSTANLSLGAISTPSVIHGFDGTSGSPTGTNITVRSGRGFGTDAGALFLQSGDGGGTGGIAGPIWILGGTGTAHGAGGDISILAGATQVTGSGDSAGGSISITAGNSDHGTPGSVAINGGTNQSGSGGSITLKTNGTNRVVITGTGQTTFSGASIFSSDVTYQNTAARIVNQNTPSTLASSVDNYNFGSFGCCLGQLFRLEAASGGSTVTGFALGATDFYMAYIFNVSGTDSITFKNLNAGSTSGNQFLTPNAADFILRPNSGALFWYDATGISKWRILSP